MAGLTNTFITNVLNATTPTGAAGVPGAWTTLGASAMKVRLIGTVGSAATAGTEITGTGYTAGGTAVPAASTASSAGSAVTLPATSAMTWTNSSGASWTINGFELYDSGTNRLWFGSFTGAPITVANGNTFQIAVGGISLGLA